MPCSAATSAEIRGAGSVDGALPTFGCVSVHRSPVPDGPAQEAAWMADAAASGGATAHLWTAPQGLVVPRSYERLPAFAAACAASAAAGWPVRVRGSGGGVVPQGPGLLDLSLVWRSESAVPSRSDAIYLALCREIASALARLGIVASPQPVAGSFCDGRYNLAVDGRKLVGTAQAWRRVDGVPVVLVHALLLLDGDLCALTARANAFEAAAGSERRYRADALTSVADCWCRAQRQDVAPAGLAERLIQVIAGQFASVIGSDTA